MEYYIKTLFAALFGTLGFGMLFKVKPKTLYICCIGGFFTWGIALICEYFNCGIFTMNLIASIFAMLFSMFAAIKLKLPSTILVTTCIIPLVPGGSLYYTMQSLIMNDLKNAYEYCTNTILTAVGIAGGILIGSIIFSAIKKPLPKTLIAKGKNRSFSKIHYMHLNKEPFEQILFGKKTYELRLYDEKRKAIKINDIIEFSYNDQIITVKVTNLNIFPSFKELYENIPFEQMGYSEDEFSTATYEDMSKYYSLEDQLKYSVVAIKFSKIDK